ncbi:hypothetical protein ACFVU2_21155 [Leifsonia sp. NPDC058194]|uniref:hypothetical protein n=1 Tax=Leifsonia sp. NPDC058194 TaxID=3346374 RepID=UPI0036DED4A2
MSAAKDAWEVWYDNPGWSGTTPEEDFIAGYAAGRRQALLDAHALCTTTTDAGAINRLIEAERTEADG